MSPVRGQVEQVVEQIDAGGAQAEGDEGQGERQDVKEGEPGRVEQGPFGEDLGEGPRRVDESRVLDVPFPGVPVVDEPVDERVLVADDLPDELAADRDRGWALRPLASGVVSGEVKQYVRINSHGFRDHERTYNKPSGAYRIAVLQEMKPSAGPVRFSASAISLTDVMVSGFRTGSGCLTTR